MSKVRRGRATVDCVYLTLSNFLFATSVLMCVGYFDGQVHSMFRMKFDDMVKTWAGVHYDWLPARDAVPKAVGARLTRHQLQSLDVSISTRGCNQLAV